MLEQFNFSSPAPLSLATLLFNLAVGFVLALLLRWHFKHFSSTLASRAEFAHVLPFILLTTTLIITIVKSSLALSLGLVGALSIVRFRTPIKEPEELAYLFLAIAIGLGLGAEQTLPTTLSAIAIMAVMTLLQRMRKDREHRNLYLSIDWEDAPEGEQLDRINELVAKHTLKSDLRRYDMRGSALEATYFIDIENVASLTTLQNELRDLSKAIGITLIDQNQMPSI